MKKIISIFCSLLTLSLFAQSDAAKKHLGRWQVVVYENVGTINNGWMYNPKYDFAVTIGANAEYKICKWLSVRSGVEFFGNKNNLRQNDGVIVCIAPFLGPSYIETKYKYLEIPFDMKFNFLSNKKVNYFKFLADPTT